MSDGDEWLLALIFETKSHKFFVVGYIEFIYRRRLREFRPCEGLHACLYHSCVQNLCAVLIQSLTRKAGL